MSLSKLLQEQIRRYCAGDSTSVPVEIAEDILRSICFVISLSVTAARGPDLKEENLLAISGNMSDELLEKMYRQGMKIGEAHAMRGRALYKEALAGMLAIDNISYQETVQEIGGFFKSYDLEFSAHEIPCDIDYQLCCGDTDLQGILYINHYLECLILENRFCSCFPEGTLADLLRAYVPDYKQQLINIFEPAAVNAIGRALLGMSPEGLHISQDDCEKLKERFLRWNQEEGKEKISEAADEILRGFSLEDAAMEAYLQRTGEELFDRITALGSGNSFSQLFLSLRNDHDEDIKITKNYEYFDDGDTMDDENLRNLIDEITDCRYLTDKIAMVQSRIRSIRDLVEILSFCFWENEVEELLMAIGEDGCRALAYQLELIRDKDPDWKSETGWEEFLNRFLKQ